MMNMILGKYHGKLASSSHAHSWCMPRPNNLASSLLPLLLPSWQRLQCCLFQVAGPHNGWDPSWPFSYIQCYSCVWSTEPEILWIWQLLPWPLPTAFFSLPDNQVQLRLLCVPTPGWYSSHQQTVPTLNTCGRISPYLGSTRARTVMDIPFDLSSLPQYLIMFNNGTTYSVLSPDMPTLIPKPVTSILDTSHLLPLFLDIGSKIKFEHDGQFH